MFIRIELYKYILSSLFHSVNKIDKYKRNLTTVTIGVAKSIYSFLKKVKILYKNKEDQFHKRPFKLPNILWKERITNIRLTNRKKNITNSTSVIAQSVKLFDSFDCG